MSAALGDGSRWLLLGGRRALAEKDGNVSIATADPAGLCQLVLLNDGTERFFGVAGDSLVRFAGPLGNAETSFRDARLADARVEAFAGRLLVRPARGEAFLVGADGRNEAPLGSALPFEASAVSFASSNVGFAATDAFGLLKTSDGARNWARAAPLLEGELATRQGVPVERVRGTGKTTALPGFALADLGNKTAAFVDEGGKDPLVLAASSGFPLADGDIAFAVPTLGGSASVGVTLLKVSRSTGEVLQRKPLGSYARRPFPSGINEPRCSLTEAARSHLLVECDGTGLFDLDERLELVGARQFEGKLRQTEMGGALAEGDCQGAVRPGSACVRNPDGSFSRIGFQHHLGSSATLLLAKSDGTLVVVDYEAQGFSVRQVDKSGDVTPLAKFGSRVKAAKIHGDLDREGTLTLVVEGTPAKLGELPQVEVSTVTEGRVKTDSFPGALTARNVGGRVVLRRASEIIARDAARAPWQRFARKAPARGEVRVSRAGFVAGDDVRIGWPLSGAPLAEGVEAPAQPLRELVCKTERNLRTLPRLDNSAIDSTIPAWTRALGGLVAIAREGSRYRVRYFTRTPINTIEELYVAARSLSVPTVAGAAIRGGDLGLLINTDKTSWAIRRTNGSASIEPITAPLSAQVEISIGADGSLAWDRGRAGARQIVLWPKSGGPRDVLTTDRNGFRFEPFDKGIDVRAMGKSVSGVARYQIGELATPLPIEPNRFKAEASLALDNLLAAPTCRAPASPETRLVDLDRAFSGVVVDGERLATTSFEVGLARAADGPCMSVALATTERSRWQLGVDLTSGTALVTKTAYPRQPASCVLQQVERSSP